MRDSRESSNEMMEFREIDSFLSKSRRTCCECMSSLYFIVFLSLVAIPTITALLTATVTDFVYTAELRQAEESLTRQSGSSILSTFNGEMEEKLKILNSLGNLHNYSGNLFFDEIRKERQILNRLFRFSEVYGRNVSSISIGSKVTKNLISSSDSKRIEFLQVELNGFSIIRIEQVLDPSSFSSTLLLCVWTFLIICVFSPFQVDQRPWFRHAESIQNQRASWYPFPYEWISGEIGLTAILPLLNLTTKRVIAVAVADFSLNFLSTLSRNVLNDLKEEYLVVACKDLENELVLLTGSKNSQDQAEMSRRIFPLSDARDPVIQALRPIININDDVADSEFELSVSGVQFTGRQTVYRSDGLVLFGVILIRVFRPELWKVIVSLLGFVVILLVVAYCLSRYISNMFETLEKKMHLLSSFQFFAAASYPQFSYFAEFRNIQRSMNNLFRSLKVFSLFVPSNVVQGIVEGRIQHGLFLKESYVTVCFLTIREFEKLAAELDAALLLRVISCCIENFCSVITSNRGTVDKISGHNLMFFFGEPVPFPETEKAACKTALEIMERLSLLREHLKELDSSLEKLTIRLGMNCGHVKVGNWGTDKRLSYTVLGDVVNYASRCSYICEQYFTPIVVTPSIVEAVSCDEVRLPLVDRETLISTSNESLFLFRKLDRQVKVKGRTSASDLYELVGFKDTISTSVQCLVQLSDLCFNMDETGDPSRVFEKILEWRNQFGRLQCSGEVEAGSRGRWIPGCSSQPIIFLSKKYNLKDFFPSAYSIDALNQPLEEF